ncbi:hypothetical protein Ndes2526B_g05121 [Nannochloris sp. 'desiccata']|nr:hypothetical protein KSW81_000053 [Chlorella desiccata (nom. nud.)]
MPYLIPQITFICISTILILFLVGDASGQHPSSFIQPFSLSDVDLDESSEFSKNEALNHDYLLVLDVDNLLYNFRMTAGLPAPGQSYGGWEGSNVEVRGQFIGHYLSALAFASKSASNNDDAKHEFQTQSDALLQGLSECQAAHGDGYLSAFPKEHFDRLEALQPVWAPFYVIHKIMQGLLDQHQLAAQPQAFEMLTSMAGYFCTWSERVIIDHGIDHWHHVLENEFGGMNDVLYKLSIEEERQNKKKKYSSSVSSNSWAACAALFDKPAWFDPLVQNQDVLSGLHANTHLAQVNGFASRFEATGDETAAAAVVNFFNIVTNRHSYSTGGSNWFEHWGDGQSLGDAIDNADAAANTQESCTTYNILKIARSLFTWTARADFADFYERAILNGVLGIQRTKSATFGQRHHHHDDAQDHSMHFTHAPNLHLSLEESRPEKLTSTERAMIAAADAVHAVHPRPAHHSVVSWPDDPATNITSNLFINSNVTVTDDEPGQPGQYIYYMPLGHEGGKGENPRAWTHGWGDRFNTFWCCYGSAVESFSKLADSIYFWYQHPSPSSSFNSTNTSFSSSSSSFNAGSGGGGGGDGGGGGGESMNESSNIRHGGAPYPPILFVNQFVSSTLRWKVNEEDVVIKQSADLYSNNVATSRVVITIPASATIAARTRTADNTTRGSGASVNFYLYWRLPSWLKNEEDDVVHRTSPTSTSSSTKMKLAVRINGETLDLSASPRVHGTHAQTISIEKEQEKQQQEAPSSFSRSLAFSSLVPSSATRPPLQLPLSSSSFKPPKFGKDSSDYIILGPEWNDGDVLEVDMPMRITVENLNDSHPEKQNLKAIMMGPFQMAGLTDNGDREIDIDPEYIEKAVTMLENNNSYSSGHGGDKGGDGVENSYPKGARLLSGKTKKYVIAPIGQLIDEKYTAYFDFVPVGPPGAVASQ